MLNLTVVIASTRPGRVGLPVGTWFVDFARSKDIFKVDLADLAEIGLPFLDESSHPRLKQYQHEHTKRWSAIVDRADAFVFVTPEYNFGMPAALVNALDFLYSEWNYKPAGFVSYGGVSGGVRSVQMAKQKVTTLKMMPMYEAVGIPFVTKFMGDDGVFKAETVHETSAEVMLVELNKWAVALKTLR